MIPANLKYTTLCVLNHLCLSYSGIVDDQSSGEGTVKNFHLGPFLNYHLSCELGDMSVMSREDAFNSSMHAISSLAVSSDWDIRVRPHGPKSDPSIGFRRK